ncbi:MAG: hypothetical protein ACI8SE_001839 [Bacteroidia bacterium]|jgi:hypothetical protein
MKLITFILALTFYSSTLSAQNITIVNNKDKQKKIELNKILAVELDDDLVFGTATGYNGVFISLHIDSTENTNDTTMWIDISEVKKLWLCPRKTDDKCQKWNANSRKNDVLLALTIGALYTAAIANRNDTALWILFNSMAVIVSVIYSKTQNPKRIRLHGKWKVVGI